MKAKFCFFLLLPFILSFSCSDEEEFDQGNYKLSSITRGEDIVEKFIYNDFGQLIESQGIYFCDQVHYNHLGQIIKVETATSVDIFSSTMIEKYLLTSDNSIVTKYSTFDYDQGGKLTFIKSYFMINNVWEYRSQLGLEYENDKVVQLNLYNKSHNLVQYFTYEYDSRGNVVKELRYSKLNPDNGEMELIMETFFKYDNKINPFRLLKNPGQPGLYTNKNNIVKEETISHVEPFAICTGPGIYYYSYNRKGLPTKYSLGDTVYEYHYNASFGHP